MIANVQAVYHLSDPTAQDGALSEGGPVDSAGFAIAVSVFADRPSTRGEIRDDAMGAGFRLNQEGPLVSLLKSGPQALGDIVLVDCPTGDAATLAALARLDTRIARSGARLIVSTTLVGLDAAFVALGESDAQILVDPTRAERIVALGQTLAGLAGARVREFSDQDRTALLRLTEQVAQLARQLGAFVPQPSRSDSSAFAFESPNQSFNGAPVDDDAVLSRLHQAGPALPDPRLVRQIIRQRQLRGRFFEGDLFADPAWDLLLDLTAARAEHQRVSVTSLCIASGAAPTTALRGITQLIEAGLLERVQDDTDKRRAFITMTNKAADAMAGYFAEIGSGAAKAV